MPKTPLLSVDRLFFERDDCNIFEPASFNVDAGDIVQIEGPNGAGKSSMLNVINGFYKPTSGLINFAGKERKEMEPEFAAKHVNDMEIKMSVNNRITLLYQFYAPDDDFGYELSERLDSLTTQFEYKLQDIGRVEF